MSFISTPNKMHRGSRRQSGFSMIELLVAVLVMGIGVLGITGLQMVSLQNNRAALETGEAVQLAYDMMDRIRANPVLASYAGVAVADAPPAGAPDCVTNACTAAQMAAFDIAAWKCTLGGHHAHATCVALRGAGAIPLETVQPGLPLGDGSIAIVGGLVTISVVWTEGNGQARTVAIDSQS